MRLVILGVAAVWVRVERVRPGRRSGRGDHFQAPDESEVDLNARKHEQVRFEDSGFWEPGRGLCLLPGLTQRSCAFVLGSSVSRLQC